MYVDLPGSEIMFEFCPVDETVAISIECRKNKLDHFSFGIAQISLLTKQPSEYRGSEHVVVM